MKRITHFAFYLLFILNLSHVTAQSVGDLRSATSGSWTNTSTWEEYNGSTWNSTLNIPTATTNVTIRNTHTVNLPTSSKECQNLTIDNGGKLWANNSTMTTARYINVYGNILCNGTFGNGNGNNDIISVNVMSTSCVISGNGSFTANRLRKDAPGSTALTISMDVELRFNGDALYNNQTTTNSLSTTISQNCLVNCVGNGASPAGDVYIQTNDKIIVHGELIVSGTLTNIPGTSGVYVKSTGSGTGSLLTSSSISATVERYVNVSSTAKNHFISSAISNAKISAILDATLGDYNAYEYDPALGGTINDKWNRVFSNDDMTAGIAYSIPYSHASTTSKTISYAGSLNSGTIEPSISSTQDDWNLIGNPYPCSISPRAFLNENAKTNAYIYGALYLWDESGSPSTSDFASMTFLGSTKGNNGNGSIPDSIALGQGFFVKSQSGSPTKVTFNSAMKCDYSSTFFTPEPDPIQRFYISVTDENDAYNEILIGYTNFATQGFDNLYDAHKLKGNSFLALYTYLEGSDKEYAIQGRPAVIDKDIIKLGLDALAGGYYEFKLARKENIPIGLRVFLIDKFSEKTILLDENSLYRVSLKSRTHSDRFELIVTYDNLLGYSEDIDANSDLITIKGSGIILTEHAIGSEIQLFDLFGRCINTWKITGENQQIDLSQYSNAYIVKLVSENKESITKKVVLH